MNYENRVPDGRCKLPLGHETCEGGTGMEVYRSLPIGMVYGVSQRFANVYEADKGLKAGTMFAELDLPFTASFGGRKC